MRIGLSKATRRLLPCLLICLWHGQAVAEPVRIAYAEVFPPFTELKDGKAAALRVGIDVQFVPVPFEEVQRTLEDGRADAVFPLTITPERLQSFDFSDPFLVTGGALFVRFRKTPQT